MSFPVAHGLLGASIVAALTSKLSVTRHGGVMLLGAAVAICPDLDYFLLVKIFHLNSGWHRGPMHSVTFALAVGILASFLLSGQSVKQALVLWAATASHGILDLFSNFDPVEILWPWSQTRYNFGVRPYYNFNLIRREPTGREILDIARICLVEFAVFAPIFLLALYMRWAVRKEAGLEQSTSLRKG